MPTRGLGRSRSANCRLYIGLILPGAGTMFFIAPCSIPGTQHFGPYNCGLWTPKRRRRSAGMSVPAEYSNGHPLLGEPGHRSFPSLLAKG